MQVIIILAAGSAICANIWIIILAFQENLVWGWACLLIPIFPAIFAIIYFKEMKTSATIYLISLLILSGAKAIYEPNKQRYVLQHMQVLNEALQGYRSEQECYPPSLSILVYNKSFNNTVYGRLIANAKTPKSSYQGYYYEYQSQSCKAYELYGKSAKGKHEAFYINQSGILHEDGPNGEELWK